MVLGQRLEEVEKPWTPITGLLLERHENTWRGVGRNEVELELSMRGVGGSSQAWYENLVRMVGINKLTHLSLSFLICKAIIK